MEQTLVDNEAGVEEDHEEQEVAEDTEDANHVIDTTVEHSVYHPVLVASDTGDEVHVDAGGGGGGDTLIFLSYLTGRVMFAITFHNVFLSIFLLQLKSS